MAEIFLALQKGEVGFEKPVVLKRILPALAQDPSFVRMLVDEAHIASTLNHSNLVQVLDLGKSGDQYFLVLEFVDGWSLEQVRKRALNAKLKLPIPLALNIVGALCRGLAYVHTRTRNGESLGIVHRDVTPQNVLLSQQGEVKLADFGIAKAVGKSERSATGVIKGKFAYMSPEQSRGWPLDARSDLFSVGSLLYLLVTGRKPFDGPTDMDVIMQVRRARPEKVSTFVRDLNPDVERFINRCLRADLAKRWQSAEQMADRIDAILVKLGQPTGPAPLKRWLETLSARDGAAPPAVPRGTVSDPSIAVELGSLDIELQAIADDQGDEAASARADTRSLGAPTHPEATANNAPTRQDSHRAAHLARVDRDAVLEGEEVTRPSAVVRFRRWVRRTTIRLALLVVAFGGALYFAYPHLPRWATEPLDGWLQRLPAPLAPHPAPDR
jgi:serine/threonine-protein kinase